VNAGILGTGTVGRTIGSRLIELGHRVRLGGRSAANERAIAWAASEGERASSGTFGDAAAFGEIVFNCTEGAHSIEALTAAGRGHLAGKVLVDVANPLESGPGRSAPLLFCNNDSLGERIQAAFPEARVVKTLNTMWCGLMVNPRLLGAPHVVYMCGNDAGAKSEVAALLGAFGWRDEEILDLGDIAASRGTEMFLPLWLLLYGRLGTASFNFTIVR